MGIRMAGITEDLEFGPISIDGDGFTTLLLDDLKGIILPGDSAVAAPEGVWSFDGSRGRVLPEGGG
jgi:hypothetical protein